MENKRRAIQELLGCDFGKEAAKKFFFNVYEFILYNDTQSFLETLDYKMSIDASEKPKEDYLVFKFMLRLLLDRHPQRLSSLSPMAM